MENIGFVTSASTWMADHKRRLFVNFSSAVMLIVICGVMGCFDFFKMAFDPGRLITAAYWSHIFARSVCLICSLNIGINIWQPYAEESNYSLQRDSLRYDGLISLKEKSFEPYILTDFNVSEKKKAWIAKINKKINTLGKFARDSSRMLWGTPEEKLNENPKMAERKLKNLYCRKRAVLEAMKDPDWINANIDSLKVSSFKSVDPSVFDLSIDGKERFSGYKLTAHTSAARGAKTANSILYVLMVSAMISTWVISIDEALIEQSFIGWVTATLNAVMDVSFVVWQSIRGCAYAPKLVEDEIHRPYIDRIRILLDYFGSSFSPMPSDVFKVRDSEILAKCDNEIARIKSEKAKAIEEKNIIKLAKIRNDTESRTNKKDSFGGGL